jgi:murein DD-endopeptidase MepM/ murein hydrolase activator NlpD
MSRSYLRPLLLHNNSIIVNICNEQIDHMRRSNNNNNNRNKKKGGRRNKQQQQFSSRKSIADLSDWNFVANAGPGCHMARQDLVGSSTDWVLEWEEIDPEEFGDDEIPDLAVDTQEHTLTLCNVDACFKVAYITVYDCALRGRNGKVLTAGSTTATPDESSSGSNNNNKLVSCTTLIVLCPPTTFAHLCYLPEDVSPSTLRLESDVQEWQKHPDPDDTHSQTIGFPLQTSSSEDATTATSFLCTQGVGGCLTHFFAGNLHAIDFQCAIGTPLLAVGNGIVVKVKADCNNVTGIAVTNLFAWNSILLQLDEDTENVIDHKHNDTTAGPDETSSSKASAGPLFVEYVHIQSAAVTVGDRVVAGQVIGTSGSAGFSPEPHLHLAAYRSCDDTAATCRVYFHTNHDDDDDDDSTPRKVYLPMAGQRYTANGPV